MYIFHFGGGGGEKIRVLNGFGGKKLRKKEKGGREGERKGKMGGERKGKREGEREREKGEEKMKKGGKYESQN